MWFWSARDSCSLWRLYEGTAAEVLMAAIVRASVECIPLGEKADTQCNRDRMVVSRAYAAGRPWSYVFIVGITCSRFIFLALINSITLTPQS